jgi:hypothetical protein
MSYTKIKVLLKIFGYLFGTAKVLKINELRLRYLNYYIFSIKYIKVYIIYNREPIKTYNYMFTL